MQLRQSSFTFLLCLLAGPFVVRAAEPGPAEAARTMVESERKFYQAAQEKGTRAAFLTFLADDAVVFRPGPVNGKEVWEKRAETGLDLIWEPTFAAMARSADFGYTTGPAKWRANKKEEKFLGYGQFVSIWKKQKDGSWKVALDLGIENPEPVSKPEPLRMSVLDDGSNVKIDFDARRKALQEAQQKFVEVAKANSVDAPLGVAAEEIRVYRDGSFPAVGKNAAGALLSAKGGKMSFESMGSGMSQSADLAYTYGKYSVTRREGAEAGHFFQIWQTDAAGSWKLVLDWQQPLPKEKP
ncbi:MAG TPA: nuclear transport factor 2 family protein [Chthoniobacterales bacterium]